MPLTSAPQFEEPKGPGAGDGQWRRERPAQSSPGPAWNVSRQEAALPEVHTHGGETSGPWNFTLSPSVVVRGRGEGGQHQRGQ